MNIELETDRLTLRMPQMSDQQFFINLYGNPDVMKHIPPKGQPSTKNEAIQRLETLIAHWRQNGYGMFVLELKAPRSPVGYCGLRYLKETGNLELGYIIDRPHWGMGIASEAAMKCLRFAKESLNTDRIISVTNPGNSGSQKILTKMGFQRCENMDGIYHGMHHHFFVLKFN
ncbi:MAG: GNAT family N-acetyltransferase [Desulfobacter sp.]|nr:MAG: GNAT family N-acetyltransferase [Desulfobacter sp.]